MSRPRDAKASAPRRALWRRAIRGLAWAGSSLLLRALSHLRGFEVPEDNLLPLFKLPMFLGTYERDTVVLCGRLLRRGDVVMDVGAHAGYFTVLFARLVGPQGRVYAFEPHPRNFAVLTRNVRRRRLANVVLLNKAVADRDGVMSLHETAGSLGHSLVAVKPGSRPTTVGVVSLDGFAEESGVAHVALVKVDVEGAEPEVFQGMRALLHRSPRLALIQEFKPSLLVMAGREPAAVLRALTGAGLAVSVIGRGGGLSPIRAGEEEDAARGITRCNLLARKE